MSRPAILIADALTALRGLEVSDAETRARVLRLLGLALAPAAAPDPGTTIPSPAPSPTPSVPLSGAVARFDAAQQTGGDGESAVPIEITEGPRMKRREEPAAD